MKKIRIIAILSIFCLMITLLGGCKKPEEEELSVLKGGAYTDAAKEESAEAPQPSKQEPSTEEPEDKPEAAPRSSEQELPAEDSAVTVLKDSGDSPESVDSEDAEEGKEFLIRSIPYFLSDTGVGNAVYSPANMYLALGMLAETAGSAERQQILDVLGMEDIETLRKDCYYFWNNQYCDREHYKLRLASSLWLADGLTYNEETLETLAQNYYASSFSGTMGDPAYTAALQNWLNEQTGGLLGGQIDTVRMTPDLLLLLATTIYFESPWAEPFSESSTREETFHGAAGDTTGDFMHASEEEMYYTGKQFAATSRTLVGGKMWLILPEEGVTPEAFLQTAEFEQFLSDPQNWGSKQRMTIHLSLPKFDIETDPGRLNAEEKLKKLGITKVFDEEANFSPLGLGEQALNLRVSHGARMLIDEHGCKAAAFTALGYDSAARPSANEVEFKLDRPFIAVITDHDGLPLFAGIVNQVA